MGNFNQGGRNSFNDNRGGNRFSRGKDSGRSSFRREDKGPITLTQTICDKCKKNCEVPFRPTTGKLVYCSDCFRNQNSFNQDRAPRRDFDNNRQQFSKSNFSNKEEGDDIKKVLESLNSKLDKIIVFMENFTQINSAPKKEIVKNTIVSLPKKEVKKEIKEIKEIKKKVGKK
ncbi:MAG: CxxC-x17-CxxC domain-containing protein [bacterium]